MGLFSRLAQSARVRTHAILIVEDEPLLAFDNEHALAHAGYHVVDTVDRYEHAVDAMALGGIDLVIADIRLPGMRDGIAVARHAASLDIPVLLSTAACPPEAQAFALGWLAKPYGPRDLVRTIAVIDAVLAGQAPRLLPETLSLFLTPSDP
ncbi:MAG TPA: response regulator [Sphingobium sp.]